MLLEALLKYGVQLHAYVLMPRFFEFVATPTNAESLPKCMQSLGRRYVGYYNKKYDRAGTLWEGRYKASLLEDERYLLWVMSYIERQAPKEHPYSSIRKNLYGKKDKLVTLHRLYKKLGYTDEERVKKYASYFQSKKFDKFIENALEKQLVTGSAEYITHLEKRIGMTLTQKGRGRPKKQTTKRRKKMYKNLVVLDKEQHKDLKLKPMEDLFFAKDLKFIPIVASEVVEVGDMFPVVFTADENPSLIVLVSLGGENLALSKDGKWIAPYVPAFLRKYPFSIAAPKENPKQRVILIDEDSSLLSTTKGEPLFNEDGSQTQILQNAIKFLTTYENEALKTANIAKLIADSGILEDREISVGDGDEKKVLVNGFKVVNREKLNALSDDILADWARKGIVTMIDAHIRSLDNVTRTLFALAQLRQK